MDNDPIVTVSSDGTVRYRASALGSCTRALVAARQEYGAIAPPRKMLDVYEAGTSAEEIAVAELKGMGHEVRFRQLEVSLPVSSSISVVGHIDGMIGLHVLEIKSQSEKEWNERYEEWDLWPRYAWQLSVYMHSVRSEQGPAPAFLMQVNRANGKLLSHEIRTPPKTRAQIVQRVLEVERLAREELSTMSCESPLMYPCPYFYTHEKEGREEITNDALESLAAEYDAARVDARLARDRQTYARDAMLEAMGEPDLGQSKKVSVGEWNITVSRFTRKEVVVAAHNETRMTVKKREEKGDREGDKVEGGEDASPPA